jgi:hypothetical protein
MLRNSTQQLVNADMAGQIVSVHLLTTVILRASTAAVAVRAARRTRNCMLVICDEMWKQKFREKSKKMQVERWRSAVGIM